MVTDVYSHIIDDDRKKNAALLEEAFYARKDLNPEMRNTAGNAMEGKVVKVPEGVDAEMLAKVMANPEPVNKYGKFLHLNPFILTCISRTETKPMNMKKLIRNRYGTQQIFPIDLCGHLIWSPTSQDDVIIGSYGLHWRSSWAGYTLYHYVVTV